jgi:transcriptional regulator with XRE-family HTH domain
MAKFDAKLLAKRVREKRDTQSLRDLAAELQISIATLSRIENGKMPDLYNFGIILEWLGDSPTMYFYADPKDTDDTIMGQLRAAQNISAETASAFMEVIRAAYLQVLDQVGEEDKA